MCTFNLPSETPFFFIFPPLETLYAFYPFLRGVSRLQYNLKSWCLGFEQPPHPPKKKKKLIMKIQNNDGFSCLMP